MEMSLKTSNKISQKIESSCLVATYFEIREYWEHINWMETRIGVMSCDLQRERIETLEKATHILI